MKKNKTKKHKLTAAQKAAKRKRRKEYMTIFIHGKQKRVKRPETIDGMLVDEWIEKNADPIWLHQHGYYEILYQRELTEQQKKFHDEENS